MGSPAEDEGIDIEVPHLYILHGQDDDVFKPALSYGLLASLLQPARVMSLVYNQEAEACSSLAELCAMYIERILKDVSSNPIAGANSDKIVLLGYGVGAVIAHEVALQAQGSGRPMGLVLLDSEVSWPPSPSMERMGGYEWLGGPIEAVLMACRALGAKDYARQEVAALAGQNAKERDAEDVKMRAFWELANSVGVPQGRFDESVAWSSYVLGKIQPLLGAPSGVFAGDALLVSSSDSPEFEGAADVNRKYCSGLETVQVPGSHYSMLQGQQAGGTAEAIAKFLAVRGYWGSAAADLARRRAREDEETTSARPAAGHGGLSVLRQGSGKGEPVIYLTQEMVPPLASAEWLQEVASLLAPHRVAVLDYDDEARACAASGESGAAAELYDERVLSDLKRITQAQLVD